MITNPVVVPQAVPRDYNIESSTRHSSRHLLYTINVNDGVRV